MNQRERDLKAAKVRFANTQRQEGFADGAEYGRKDARKDVAKKLRVILEGCDQDFLLWALLYELELAG